MNPLAEVVPRGRKSEFFAELHDVAEERIDGTSLRAVRQEYAGQVSTHVAADVANGGVITVRSGAFKPAQGKAEMPSAFFLRARSPCGVGVPRLRHVA